jgi:ABC-type glycerol-3-phosphate transport system substrate-binding protein
MEREEKTEDKKSQNVNPVVTRRKALSKMATAAIGAGAVIVVGGVAYYLSSQAPPTTTTTTAATTSEVMTSAAATANKLLRIDPNAPPQGTLNFDMWNYHPEIVQKYADQFAQENPSAPKVNVAVIGGNYASVMQTKFMANVPVDIFYAQSAVPAMMYYAGWAQVLDDLPAMNNVLNDIDPSFKKYITYDNHVIGLPYFTTPTIIFMNHEVNAKYGYGYPNYPENYTELYAQIHDLVKKGVKYPYLPLWTNDESVAPGAQFQLFAEAQIEGDELFDSSGNPTFDTNTPIADVMNAWRSLVTDKCVNTGVLDVPYAQWTTWMYSGTYPVMQEWLYDLAPLNAAGSPVAGKMEYVYPSSKQKAWGLNTPSIYMVHAKDRNVADHNAVLALEGFFGYKTQAGEFLTAKTFADISMLNSGYTAVNADPSVRDTWVKNKWLINDTDFENAGPLLGNSPSDLPFMRWPWGQSFASQSAPTVQEMIVGRISIPDGIAALRKAASDLLAEYGLGKAPA